MKSIRNIVAATAAGAALALGATAFAQDAKQPAEQQPVPQAGEHSHRGGHHGTHAMRGEGMRGGAMRGGMNGGCQGEGGEHQRGEHRHGEHSRS